MSDVSKCPSCGQKNRMRPSTSGAPKCGKCGVTLPWVVNADTASFSSEVKSSLLVVLDFWAPWCGPCRMISPVLEDLAGKHVGKLKVVKVNVDENPALAQKYNARSIPLLVLKRDGKEVTRVVGALPKPALEAKITPYL